MATNMIYPGGRNIAFTTASTVDTEEPVLIGGSLPGVATLSYSATTGKSTINMGASGPVYDLSVVAVDDSGNTTVAVGDPIFFTAGTLNRKASGKLYGYALEAITTVGGTSTINVLLAENSNAIPTARGTYELFEVSPVAAAITSGACAGTAASINLLSFGANVFQYVIKGTQTIKVPVLTDDGLNVALDQTANDGLEMHRGYTALSPEAFVIGTDAFYAKLRFTIADVSGTDDCAFGFRKAEASQANIDDYADMAALNVIAGDIKIETIVGGAATVTTDTTDNWADTATHELEVRVSSAGVVTYKIDGAAPTVTAAYTFTSGLTVIPFFFFLHDTDLVDTLPLKKWESGLQA